MLRLVSFITLVFVSAISSADEKIAVTQWLNKPVVAMHLPAETDNSGMFIESDNLTRVKVHLLLQPSTLVSGEKKAPASVEGKLYFDGELFAPYKLVGGLNIHQFQGIDYVFHDDFYGDELYEKLQFGKVLTFEYQGIDQQVFSLNVSIEKYYEGYNRFAVERMMSMVPSFLDYSGRVRYKKMVEKCQLVAQGTLDDLDARNQQIPLELRMQALESEWAKDTRWQSHFSADEMKGRAVMAYDFYGDTSKPDRLLFLFFSNCYNRNIAQFN